MGAPDKDVEPEQLEVGAVWQAGGVTDVTLPDGRTILDAPQGLVLDRPGAYRGSAGGKPVAVVAR